MLGKNPQKNSGTPQSIRTLLNLLKVRYNIVANAIEDVNHITDVPAGHNLFESMEQQRMVNRPKMEEKTLYRKDYPGHEIHPSEA